MMTMMDVSFWLYVLAGALIFFGLLGTVLPLLPGIPMMFVGMLLAAWTGDFKEIGWIALVVLGVMVAIAIAADIAAGALGAKKIGASNKAMIGAALGTLVGIFFGIPGMIVGPFVGAVLGELAHRGSFHRDHLGEASKIGFGTWLGMIIGAAMKIAVAFAMLAVFAVSLAV